MTFKCECKLFRRSIKPHTEGLRKLAHELTLEFNSQLLLARKICRTKNAFSLLEGKLGSKRCFRFQNIILSFDISFVLYKNMINNMNVADKNITNIMISDREFGTGSYSQCCKRQRKTLFRAGYIAKSGA